MNRSIVLGALLTLIPMSRLAAGELLKSKPEDVGLTGEKLAAAGPALQKLVDEGKIAGGVALVARHGKVAYVAPFGYRDLATKTPMTEDTIFAIASMTKPITCVAAMTLVEQGKLGLDDPITKYLPELGGLRVLGNPKDDTENDVATVPAKRPATVRDLLSHTSGFAYGGLLSFNPRLGKVYDKVNVQDRSLKTISDQVARLAKVPLAHQPGEGWTYGLSHDVLGRVIEVATGQTFEAYLQERILTPLDMRDTSFYVPVAKRGRVATIYRAPLAGPLAPLPKGFGSQTFFSGGGGLFSTTRDYARFAQMLLNKGELDGTRILTPGSIAMMTTNQIGGHSAFFLYKYGLGFGLEMVRGQDGGKPALRRYFWGGVFSTNFWVDPRHDLIGVIMTQVLPTNSGGAERVFHTEVEAAIQD